jgi:hypothetical protein
MRISVYLKQQDPLVDSTPHETSRRMAAWLVGSCICRPVGQNAIQICSDQSWQDIKNLLRHTPDVETGLLPPLDWYYPWTDLPQWLLRCYRRYETTAA